jgi:Holliday junction resolvase RusA-like endonuclease
MLIEAFIEGRPIPQGSKSAAVVNGRAVMFEANKNHKAWRQTVSAALEGLEPTLNPVRVELLFTFIQPKTVKRSHMSVKPDLDKLIRTVLDAATGRVFKDDSQVIILNARKDYGTREGVLFRAYEVKRHADR